MSESKHREINSGTRFKEKNFGPLRNFFDNKTVLPANKFIGSFYDDSNNKKNLYDNIGYMPPIQPHHITSVTFDQSYQFSRDELYMINFATIDSLQPKTELAITLQEDVFGNVARFINWCQRKLITKDGVMRPRYFQCINSFTLQQANLEDVVVGEFVFKNIYFQTADPINLTYDNDDALSYTVTFGYYDWEYIPMTAIDNSIQTSYDSTLKRTVE